MGGPAAPKMRRETDDLEVLLNKVIEQFQRTDAQIQFIGEPYSPPASTLEVEVPIEVTDAAGVREAFTNVIRVQVNITGGTAPGAQIQDGNRLSPIGGSLEIPLIEGRRVIKIIATGTGTVLLSLIDSAGSGLDLDDPTSVTFS